MRICGVKESSQIPGSNSSKAQTPPKIFSFQHFKDFSFVCVQPSACLHLCKIEHLSFKTKIRNRLNAILCNKVNASTEKTSFIILCCITTSSVLLLVSRKRTKGASEYSPSLCHPKGGVPSQFLLMLAVPYAMAEFILLLFLWKYSISR